MKGREIPLAKSADDQFHSVEEAIEDIKNNRIVIVVDSIKRENEGDFICAAANVTPQMINFMVTHARGAFIAAFSECGRCEELGILPQRTSGENTEANKTRMMVSVDAAAGGSGSSTGDRALTMNILARNGAVSNELRKPGHVIPIEAVSGGILERQGHTEAGVELVKLAGIKPAVAVDLEILDTDGNMASREYLFQMAEKFGLKIINIDQIVSFVREKTG
jgi:3,4-dihydroxy 2-butanone 4-phosphate synthase/GTP cyclohydrolase II|tara:strand:+ start:832 stop:1494 length:663 start_codon:yes stop_codon:yes gene_type:complete